MRAIKCLAAVLALGAFVLVTPAFAGAKVGSKAPEFSLPDLDGKTHNLVDILKQDDVKAVVLEWFNHDCPVCARHGKAKSVIEMVSAYKSKGVVFLGIDSTSWHEGKESNIKEVVGKWGVNYPILADFDGKTGRAFGAKTTPHMFIINKEGMLVYDGAIDDDRSGTMSADERTNFVGQALDQLLAGETIARSKTKPYGCSVKYKQKD